VLVQLLLRLLLLLLPLLLLLLLAPPQFPRAVRLLTIELVLGLVQPPMQPSSNLYLGYPEYWCNRCRSYPECWCNCYCDYYYYYYYCYRCCCWCLPNCCEQLGY